jgi:PKD repeat protein
MAGACFQQSIYGQGWTFNSSHAWAQAGTYTVKVTVSDCKGGTDSLSLTINVGAAVTPSVTILSPNGGESWTFGNIYGITWKSSGVKNASVYLWFSDGTTCKLADVPAENGKYSVQFAENQLCTTQNISIKVTAGRYRIKIYTENGKVDDSSDNYFSIISSGTGLMDTENMLASISQAVSQIAERIKELMGR